jgi:ubiquinone/menaquinone biosynthesis C-methylase UbiE
LVRFGLDAPYVPVGLGAGAALLTVLARVVNRWLALPAVVIWAATMLYLHTTLRGKHVVWRRELGRLGLNGNERLLDVGCGSGAVLVAAAQRLPCGRADGVDLWRSVDQSGNDPARTLANAREFGVADRIRLHTCDMTDLPFPDGSFDVVTSALAVRNIPTTQGRRKAVAEMARVLKPGGRLVLIDIKHARDYATALADTMANLTYRRLGVNYWYGWPWTSAAAVTGVRKSRVARSWRHHHLAVRAAGEGQFPA